MYLEILRIKKFYYFLFLSFLIIFFAYFVQSTFVSEAIYLNTYSEMMTSERIEEIFKSIKSYQFWGYALLPLLLLVKVGYNTFFITTATLLEEGGKYNFSDNYNICLKAEFVFIIMQIIKIYSFASYKKVLILNDINFTPLSALNLFNLAVVPKWFVYPLQTLNFWEILYCYLGVNLFASKYDIPKRKAFMLFCIPYIIGVLILILISSFLLLQFS